MSRRSAKSGHKTSAGRGKPLPKPPVDAVVVARETLDNILQNLAHLNYRIDNFPLISAKDEMRASLGGNHNEGQSAGSVPINKLSPVSSPAIKDRLGALCERQAMLLNRMQGSRNYLFGQDAPGTGSAEIAKPYSLPEHLDQLEMLLDSCINNFDAISSRF